MAGLGAPTTLDLKLAARPHRAFDKNEILLDEAKIDVDGLVVQAGDDVADARVGGRRQGDREPINQHFAVDGGREILYFQVFPLFPGRPDMHVIAKLLEGIEGFAAKIIDLLRFQGAAPVRIVGLDGAGAEVLVEPPVESDGGNLAGIEPLGHGGLDPDVRIGVGARRAQGDKHDRG